MEILEAAARLIVEHGYGACTMRSVSERVRIKAGSLYYHFASKDDIVVEIMNMGARMLLEEVQSALDALPASASFRDKFFTAVKTHVACKVDVQTPYMQVYEHLPPVIKRKSRSMRRKYAQFWFTLLKNGQASGDVRPDIDVETFVPFLLGGLNRIPEWFRHDKADEQTVGDVIASSLLFGIVAPRRLAGSADFASSRIPAASE